MQSAATGAARSATPRGRGKRAARFRMAAGIRSRLAVMTSTAPIHIAPWVHPTPPLFAYPSAPACRAHQLPSLRWPQRPATARAQRPSLCLTEMPVPMCSPAAKSDVEGKTSVRRSSCHMHSCAHTLLPPRWCDRPQPPPRIALRAPMRLASHAKYCACGGIMRATRRHVHTPWLTRRK